MTSIRVGVFVLMLSGLALGKEASSPTVSQPGEFVFSLVPKPFQKDPRVDFAVITEMTPAGRKIAPPTADRPAFYIAQAAGYHDEGQGIDGERPVPPAVVQSRLETALRADYYLPSRTGHPASLVLIFVWGSDNDFDQLAPTDGSPGEAVREDVGHAHLLARAALVGGDQFAKDFAHALAQQDALSGAGYPIVGVRPLDQFMDRSYKTRQLVEQARADCYYVVASAYDAAALAHGQHVLLWRTKMTANSQGVSMAGTLPALIEGGVHYFGRDMKEAATLSGHLIPLGRVDVGTPVPVSPGGSTR